MPGSTRRHTCGTSWTDDLGHRAALVMLVVATAAGCSEFPHADDVTVHTIEPVSLDAESVRYTFWLDDGAQRVVLDAAEVPDPARHAVLVHVEGEETSDLHGPTGWVADLTEEKPKAHLRPMAVARTGALAAWSGVWAGDWLAVRSQQIATIVDRERRLEATAARVEEGVVEPDETGEPGEPGEGAEVDALSAQLSDRGIEMDDVAMERALRNVAARRPLPRDFGLSVDVEPGWLFVEKNCSPCDAAMKAVESEETPGAHALLVSDPTNARTIRALAKRAGVEPAVPALWIGDRLIVGYDDTWTNALRGER